MSHDDTSIMEKLSIESLENVCDHFFDLADDARAKADEHVMKAREVMRILIKRGAMKLRVNVDSGIKHLVHPTNQWGTACGIFNIVEIRFGVGPTCGNCKRILKARKRRSAHENKNSLRKD